MEVRCLAPDCTLGFESVLGDEAAKRLAIDHMNAEHDEVHVIAACVHDLGEPEYWTEETPDPSGVVTAVRLQRQACKRCGQDVVTADERAEPEPVNAPPDGENDPEDFVNAAGEVVDG